MKKRIAHLVLSLELGGLERLVVSFLASIDRRVFEVVLGCLEGPGELAREVERMGVGITTFGRRQGIDLRLVPALARWLRRWQADLLHTHNSAPHFYGSLAASLVGVPVIHTKHGRDWPDRPRKVLLNRISSFLTTKVVAVSGDAYCVARDIEKVNPDKLSVIANGVDVTRYRRSRDRRPPTRLTLGTVARLSPEKDQKTLLRAFDILHARRQQGLRLLIAGDGPMRTELQNLAVSLPSGASIQFLGSVEDVPSLLSSLDVFVLTSTSEGIPLALLEAGAAGLPTVATRVGGVAEVIVEGETGLLVPAGDPEAVVAAVERLLDDEELREAMGERARRRIVEQFSLEAMTRKYEELYLASLAADRS